MPVNREESEATTPDAIARGMSGGGLLAGFPANQAPRRGKRGRGRGRGGDGDGDGVLFGSNGTCRARRESLERRSPIAVGIGTKP
jgi:hypothetical protein